MRKEKFETCSHTESVGTMAVFVKPTCPHAAIIKGKLVSSKTRCRNCARWEKRKAAYINQKFDKAVKEMVEHDKKSKSKYYAKKSTMQPKRVIAPYQHPLGGT